MVIVIFLGEGGCAEAEGEGRREGGDVLVGFCFHGLFCSLLLGEFLDASSRIEADGFFGRFTTEAVIERRGNEQAEQSRAD